MATTIIRAKFLSDVASYECCKDHVHTGVTVSPRTLFVCMESSQVTLFFQDFLTGVDKRLMSGVSKTCVHS
jgi:hypothetical protein